MPKANHHTHLHEARHHRAQQAVLQAAKAAAAAVLRRECVCECAFPQRVWRLESCACASGTPVHVTMECVCPVGPATCTKCDSSRVHD
jgi:hypothetical protein